LSAGDSAWVLRIGMKVRKAGVVRAARASCCSIITWIAGNASSYRMRIVSLISPNHGCPVRYRKSSASGSAGAVAEPAGGGIYTGTTWRVIPNRGRSARRTHFFRRRQSEEIYAYADNYQYCDYYHCEYHSSVLRSGCFSWLRWLFHTLT
jgi:hypothetical protein